MSVKNLSKESIYFKEKEKEYVQYVNSDYIIVRLDGRGFSKFTKGFDKPFDKLFMDLMEETAQKLSESTANVVMYYTQSDEISLLFYRGNKKGSQMIWNGKVSKLISDTVSTTTAIFNSLMENKYIPMGLNKSKYSESNNIYDIGRFDGRVLEVSKEDILEYFNWRQRDCIKNYISMLADKYYSHKELDGKSTQQRKEMIEEKGFSFDSLPSNIKYGRLGYKNNLGYKTVNGKNTSYWVRDVDTPLFDKESGKTVLKCILPIEKDLSYDNLDYKVILRKDNKRMEGIALSNNEKPDKVVVKLFREDMVKELSKDYFEENYLVEPVKSYDKTIYKTIYSNITKNIILEMFLKATE